MQWASSTTSRPHVAASRGSTWSRKPGLLSRSGLTRRTSTSPAATRLLDRLPLLDVGGVDGHRADAGALGGGDLVAHQGQQRRDDHRRAGTLGPEQQGGDEVDRGLAPPGALHHERAPALDDQRLDRRPLVVAQRGVVATDQRPEVALGRGADVGGGRGHRPCLAVTPDRRTTSSTGVPVVDGERQRRLETTAVGATATVVLGQRRWQANHRGSPSAALAPGARPTR